MLCIYTYICICIYITTKQIEVEDIEPIIKQQQQSVKERTKVTGKYFLKIIRVNNRSILKYIHSIHEKHTVLKPLIYNI